MSGPNQLDEISAAIGEVRAYAHEHRHAAANLSQKFDALGLVFERRFAEFRGEVMGRVDRLQEQVRDDIRAAVARIEVLENAAERRAGAAGLASWFVRNWPALAGLGAMAAIFVRLNGGS